MLHDLLGSEKVIVRFISLYIFGLVLFFAAWTVSYWVLPEGLITGFGPLNALASESAADTPLSEFLTIFGVNLIGLYEMMAATLLAAATNSISANRSETFRSSSQRVPKAERRPLSTGEWVAVGGSVLMLAAAALREAHTIISLG